jgi:hypothetical protein
VRTGGQFILERDATGTGGRIARRPRSRWTSFGRAWWSYVPSGNVESDKRSAADAGMAHHDRFGQVVVLTGYATGGGRPVGGTRHCGQGGTETVSLHLLRFLGSGTRKGDRQRRKVGCFIGSR